MPYDTERQFRLTPEEYLAKLDFLNWYRYFFIVRELCRMRAKTVLEIGPGEGTVKRVMLPFVETYTTMDINERLGPDVVSDVRISAPELSGKFDAVIAADILEHIPFPELLAALRNMHEYLAPGGHALITIPHRAWFTFRMSWRDYRHHVLRAPGWFRTLYHRLKGRRENPIDPDHAWEIGDGTHRVRDVEERMRDAGFAILKREPLLYVDFWVLRK